MSEHLATDPSKVLTDNSTPPNPEAQQLIEAPSLGFELPPTTANGETTKEQDNKLVADELARLIGAEGTNSDQSREDLLAYIREIMSDEESPYPFERAVISELLAKNQRYKLCNEIADTSNHLIDELTSENISSSENRLTLCDDIKERMNGAPLAGISGLIPDHKEFVGIRLGTDYNSAMKGYEKLRIRASKRRDDIEGLERSNNNVGSLDNIIQDYKNQFDAYYQRNREIDQALTKPKTEGQPEGNDPLSVIDPEVLDYVINSLVEAVKKAEDRNESTTSLLIDIINGKNFDIDAILSDCDRFISDYRSNRFASKIRVNDAVIKAKGNINRFFSEASYATVEGNSPDAAKEVYESQAALLDETVKNIDNAKRQIEDDRIAASNDLSARVAEITRAPEIKAQESPNVAQFNPGFKLE